MPPLGIHRSGIGRDALLTVFLALPSIGTAQSGIDHQRTIDTTCLKIRAACANAQVIEMDLPDERTTEGSTTTCCIGSQGFMLQRVNWYGETGKKEVEYYFRNDSLIFALETRTKFDRPIYWSRSTADSWGDTVTFDPARSIVEQDRYYFRNERLVLWLDGTGRAQDLDLGANTLIGDALLAHARHMRMEVERSRSVGR